MRRPIFSGLRPHLWSRVGYATVTAIRWSIRLAQRPNVEI